MMGLNCIYNIDFFLISELQKFIGSMLFGVDIDLYDEATNQRAKANTSDLNEELGQVKSLLYEPPYQKTNNLHMRKQRCKSAVQ